jgi:hypothetical protein
MTVGEKNIQPANEVRLYKEGVFGVACGGSAYCVWLQKSYKPAKRFVKRIGREIVSLRFSASAGRKPSLEEAIRLIRN